ncbi:MAG: Uma2 family endonuclease [Saprospiraceae bacterium]|nr:Uma2 family endonuclease [Saprospiraceae bacterium]
MLAILWKSCKSIKGIPALPTGRFKSSLIWAYHDCSLVAPQRNHVGRPGLALRPSGVAAPVEQGGVHGAGRALPRLGHGAGSQWNRYCHVSCKKKGSGSREFKLNGLFYVWFAQTNLGEFFSPSTGFDLPSASTKSPDVAWISPERLAANPGREEDFVKIVPDFVAEVRSGTDRLKKPPNQND